MEGFFILNKPVGITSFEAIKQVKKYLRKKENIVEKRIGHIGTLDPFAEGVLILAFGRYTKLFFLFDNMPKEYIATGIFGESRNTDDIDGDILELSYNINKLSFEELNSIIKNNFCGNIIQKPPIYSAKKVNGKRAYDMARSNESFELKNVNVFINNIELIDYDYPNFKIKTSVSKGTYIRAIIRDIGIITKNLAYTKSLKRVSIGNYNIDMSSSIENIDSNNILSFLDMFENDENIDKEIIKDKKIINQILCGNMKIIENIKIKNKYLALFDNNGFLLSIISKCENNNKYLFVNKINDI